MISLKLSPGPAEIADLRRRANIMKVLLCIFLALIVVFSIVMSLPFDGFNSWFWIVFVLGGCMLLASLGIIHLLDAKVNRQISKGCMIYREGIITREPNRWPKTRRHESPIIELDGENLELDAYVFSKVKRGDHLAYLYWDDFKDRIDWAIGADAIAAMKARRNIS